jgi:cytoskeletal protein CcmA (bactofilin family)
MFKRRRTRIAEKLKIIGSVTAEGAVEVNGDLEGDLTCASLDVSRKAHIRGSVQASRIVVNGKIEGPIRARTVILKSHAHVVGDIMAKTLSIKKGAFFDGRSANIADKKEDLPMPNGSKKGTSKNADLDKTSSSPSSAEGDSVRVISTDVRMPKKKSGEES